MLEKLRNRTEDERRAVAVLVAGLVALVLFLVWGSTFFHTKSTPDAQTMISVPQNKAQTASIQNIFTRSQKDIIQKTKEATSEYQKIRSGLQKRTSQTTSTQRISGNSVINVSLDNTGAIKVQNVMVGPIQK